MAKPKPITNIADPRYAKALAHPLRIRALAMLEEERASPVVLAERLGEPLGVVAYHVRTLYNLGLIELVGTRQRRGATEHYYQAREHPRITDEAWQEISLVTRQRLLSSMLQQIGEYATGSAAIGGFDRPDAHITRTALKLDEKGWTDLAAASKKWLREVSKIEDAAGKRLSKGGEDVEPLDVGLVILLFEALPFVKRPPTDKARPTSRSKQRART
jgi:DNA-binding transcriptional ArsR family regulator